MDFFEKCLLEVDIQFTLRPLTFPRGCDKITAILLLGEDLHERDKMPEMRDDI